jgi:hypothetical protein
MRGQRHDRSWIGFSILVLFLIVGCAKKARDVENYGDVTGSPGGIRLIDPSEHVGGWGRRDCLLCHNASLSLHRGPGSVIDVDALNESIRHGGESAYCLQCHGPNGVE